MKTIKIENTKLIKLKNKEFFYCDKKFKQERYLTEDRKIFITSDYGFNYCMVYIADISGKGQLCYDLYHKGNYSSYPIYDINSAIKKIQESNLVTEYVFNVHESQY